MDIQSIKQKGLIISPADLDKRILFSAAMQLKTTDNDYWLEIFSWLPLIGLIYLLNEFRRKKAVVIMPEFYL